MRMFAVLLTLMAFASPAGVATAKAASCPMFPKTWAYNQRVDRLPLLQGSTAIVRSMGADNEIGPGFTRDVGLPYTEVTPRTGTSLVDFMYHSSSDHVPYPLGGPLKIQTDTDRHAMLLDRQSCKLYELWDLRQDGGRWKAGSGVAWNLRSTKTRPLNWTSADAAGLPILPLLVKKQEVDSGVIRHALRITTPRTRAAFVYPATHYASDSNDPTLPRMGERLRLKRSVSLAGLAPEARVLAVAMQRYGVVVADNGIKWSIGGVPDAGWDSQRLDTLGRFTGKDFEVVDTRRLPR